jgi:RNA polymerase sporulation-specific sigma factor
MTDLLRKAQDGDEEAREEFIKSNMGLVIGLARRYFRNGEADDIIQAGAMGLVKAMDRFKFEMNTSFSTYAVPMILGEIRRQFRDDGIIKISRKIKENSIRVAREKERYIKETGEEPCLSDISERLGMNAEEITAAVQSSKRTIALFQEDENGASLDKFIGTEDEGLDEKADLSRALGMLDDKERYVLVHKYYRGLTQSQIAEGLGISQAQISRIEKTALLKLKSVLE